jgi:hypothetical protein
MAKNLLKSIVKIVESSGTNNITIFTNHLKIDGKLFIPEGKCEECHDDFITLENALLCRLSDYCTCEQEDCNCDDFVCFKYDWVNVAIDDIVAFSIVQ